MQAALAKLAHAVDRFSRVAQHLVQGRAHGLTHGRMGDDAVAKKSAGALAGEVDELIGQHGVERCHVFFQRTDGRQRHQVTHAQRLEGPKVGQKRNLTRCDAVMATVARQKDHGHALECSRHEGVGRWAIGRLDIDFSGIFQPLNAVQAAAANDADAGDGGACDGFRVHKGSPKQFCSR